MSETVFRIIVSELKTLRVRCNSSKCAGTALEFPVERWDSYFDSGYCCPVCKERFGPPKSTDNPIKMLAQAIEELQRDAKEGRVEVEFVLPTGG